MAVSNARLRDVLVDHLEDLPRLNVYGLPVAEVSTPAVVVAGIDMTEIATGAWETTVEVWVVVSRRHIDQMTALDALLDPEGDGSVLDKINGIVADGLSFAVAGVGDYREIGTEPAYWAATVTVKVWR